MKIIIVLLLLFLSGCYTGGYSAHRAYPRTQTVYNPQTGNLEFFGATGNPQNPSYLNYNTGEIYAPMNRDARPPYINYSTGEIYQPLGDYMYQDSKGNVYFVH